MYITTFWRLFTLQLRRVCSIKSVFPQKCYAYKCVLSDLPSLKMPKCLCRRASPHSAHPRLLFFSWLIGVLISRLWPAQQKHMNWLPLMQVSGVPRHHHFHAYFSTSTRNNSGVHPRQGFAGIWPYLIQQPVWVSTYPSDWESILLRAKNSTGWCWLGGDSMYSTLPTIPPLWIYFLRYLACAPYPQFCCLWKTCFWFSDFW